MDICWLGTRESQNPARVGGKAAQLARLAVRHPVPPGFCISGGNDNGLDNAFRRAYRRLGACCGSLPAAVAVRSSGVDEDGQQASFAGQHETYLNVRGDEPVLRAVQDCICSAHSERARHYRHSHGLTDVSKLAVLVQQFIPADVSAVVFSADPCTGRRDRILINAVWGLGESLVGGMVTPDLYYVDKSDLSLLRSQVADKALMTVACPGGTQEVSVPRAMRRESALTEAQVLALSRLALTLEYSQGWPVDLECAFSNEKLYLLQCRPITTV